jgi:K(+)-stimulated pyrophosphate-energized sodium pump
MNRNRVLVGSILLLVTLAVPLFAQDELVGEPSFGIGGAVVMEQSTGIPWLWWVAPIGSLLGLVVAYYFYKAMTASEKGNEKMEAIASYVREGAYAYLFRQYKVVALVFLVLFLIFVFLAYYGIQNPFVPVAFVTAGFFSALCGFFGMKSATMASSRTAQGALHSLNRALQVAFRSGAVMGLVVVSFGLLNITFWYWLLDRLVYTPEHMQNGLVLWGLTLVRAGMDPAHKLSEITTTMITFGMGASTPTSSVKSRPVSPKTTRETRLP